MSERPRILDLFCGAGGAAMGYHRAGFDVTGVDLAPQPRYPFAFVLADALAYVAAHGREFDAIHASPPCQKFTALAARWPGRSYPNLIDATRAGLEATGRPWAIENVPGAPLRHHITLCGTMFGLRVYRHRRFETSWLMFQPEHPAHTVRAGGHKSQRQRKQHYLAGGFVTITGNVGSYCGPGMGIDWMTGEELSQAIPPAYTEWVGLQLRKVLI
jgi:DNA (cytosine-5)-methyltransferase 1